MEQKYWDKYEDELPPINWVEEEIISDEAEEAHQESILNSMRTYSDWRDEAYKQWSE